MNKLVALLFACLLGQAYAQQEFPTDSINVTGAHPEGWITYLDEVNFTIEYQFTACDPPMGYDKEMVLLKITNKSRELLAFDWHMVLYYSKECKTCDYFDEYHYIVNVNPESYEEGSCDMYADHQMKIFSAFIDSNFSKGEKLISFKLDNLTITTVTID